MSSEMLREQDPIQVFSGLLFCTQIERFWRDMSFGCGLLPPLRCGEA